MRTAKIPTAGAARWRSLRSITHMSTVCALLANLCCTGCATTSGQSDLRRELDLKNERIAALERENASLKAAAAESRRQVEIARGIDAGDRALLVAPEKITLDTRSGPADLDNQPGADGLMIHLKLFDHEGDAIKAVGDIRIDAFDLSDPANPRTVGTWSFPAEQAIKLWLGKFMTYHYSLKCPWQNGPPRSSEITVRATFIDLLTKRVLTTQQAYSLPAKPAAATTQP